MVKPRYCCFTHFDSVNPENPVILSTLYCALNVSVGMPAACQP